MSLEQELMQRAQNACELCQSKEQLEVYQVPARTEEIADNSVLVCQTCYEQLNDSEKVDANHWRCLNDSMWSETPAVKVVAYRMLHHLKNEGWPQDLLEMMYLEDETLAWAKETLSSENNSNSLIHKDSNGAILEAGDSVTLIKDLPVKGSSMVAKRGTAVRRISLVHDNAEHIEGKVDGQQIVILTKYVKKI